MSEVTLLLGPIVFRDFEVPSGINFGGRQRLAVHRLPGGARVIDSLGRDDAQIHFSGIFTGSDATLRARSLDELRVGGIVLPLTWDVFFYTVLVSEFRADYRNGWWIPYRIVCTVLQDEASALLHQAVSLATAALADVGFAAGYSLPVGIDLATLQASIAAAGSTTRGTAAYTAARSAFENAQASIDTSIDAAEARLMKLNISGAGSPQAGIAGLLTATDNTEQLSSLTTARAYVRRAANNLATAST